jgi:hypothetical protein
MPSGCGGHAGCGEGEERICEGAITCSISNPPFLLGGDRVKLAY